MTDSDRERLQRIFAAALVLRPSERARYLERACGSDEGVRREVESLLGHHDRSAGFLGVYSSVGGRTLAHYRILHLIQEGGMGLVYKALDTTLDRVVAVKLLPSWQVGNPASRQQLREEARVASSLSHPNIVVIHELGRHEDIDFIVMEYLIGNTLDRVAGRTCLPVRSVLRYALQAAAALTAIHSRGIVHRDLKPSNLIITLEGNLKLLDLGLASPSGSPAPQRDMFGTSAWQAPELLGNRTSVAGPRTDIFSFGLILHYMLGGKHPFGSATFEDVKHAILTKSPNTLRRRLPKSLTVVVQRCLTKRPSERYQTMKHVYRALETCCRENGVTVFPRQPETKNLGTKRRSP